MTKETIKHISDVLKAYSNGETIQYLRNGQWFDFLEGELTFEQLSYFEFRIKPELKLRPYKNAKEFFQAMKEHGPYYIQIDSKDNEYYMLPINVRNNGFQTWSDQYCTFIEFAQLCEWQDGHPTGILE